jgi:predicted patatin/cPLA2 family phospholipase
MSENSTKLAAANLEEKNFNERMRLSLRKMIKSCDNYIKEAKNYDQLQDNLIHMEETDENFHKYELVEMLSDKLDTSLGGLIDKNVNDSFNSSKFDGDIDSQLAEKICNDIIKTKE